MKPETRTTGPTTKPRSSLTRRDFVAGVGLVTAGLMGGVCEPSLAVRRGR